MEEKKILYITYDGITDNLGQSQILPYLVGLSNLGYNITIISCEKQNQYQERNKIVKEILSKAKIAWIPTHYHKSPPILSTIYDLYNIHLEAKKICNNRQVDIIHCRSYLPSIIGLKLKRKHKTKFLFDMRGFWADERVDGKLWNLKNPIFRKVYNYFKRKEEDFVNQADAIVSLTHAGKEEMKRWDNAKAFQEKIEVIPCCVDTDLFDPRKIDSKLSQLKRNELKLQNDDFIISYLGSIGTWYMLDEMLQFFKSLKKEKPNSKMLFISPKGDHKRIRLGFKKMTIEEKDVRILESSRDHVPLYLSLSSFSIFFIKTSFSKKSSSPTKQGEIMALGIPVICNSGVGDTTSIVKNYESGICIDEFSQNGFSQAVHELETKMFNPEKLRNGAIDYFSLKKGIMSYEKIYSSLTN